MRPAKKSTGLVLALIAGLFLAGCETPTEQVAVDGSASPADPPPPPPSVPFDPESATPYNGLAALPPIDDDPKQLLGLDRAMLNEKLGEPALIRRDGDAEIWQYRADSCVLDLFLYGLDKAVEHVDLRSRGAGGGSSVSDCFTERLRAALPST
jgi:hypothetical protein